MKHIAVFLITMGYCFAAEQSYFKWASSIRQGDRKTMEDYTLNIFPLLDDPTQGLFGVFDGHGGHQTADYAVRNFASAYLMHNNNGIPDYSDLFESLNQMIYDNRACYSAGTCALVGYINKYTYNLAWVGDSRAVGMSDGQELFETLDHKLINKQERRRIIESKGNIYQTNFNDTTIDRCCCLVISRALGNKELCKAYATYKNSIISKPDTIQGMAKPGDLLILACDGIWDVFKSEDACAFIRKMLICSPEDVEKMYPKNPLNRTNAPDQLVEEKGDEYLQLIARALRDEAYKRNSADNLSVQIIQFQ